jgi:hypothetical protein
MDEARTAAASMLDDAIVTYLVPDRMWRVVRERLHRQAVSWPVDRAAFAALIVAVLHDTDWTGAPRDEPDWYMRALFLHSLAQSVWNALVADADASGDAWTHAVGVAGNQRARRDLAVAVARRAADRHLSTRDGGGCG